MPVCESDHLNKVVHRTYRTRDFCIAARATNENSSLASGAQQRWGKVLIYTGKANVSRN